MKQFRQFQCVWLEFIYNITYRRAHISSFGVLYRILKFSKGNTTNHQSIFNKLISYLKVLLYALSILSWNLITGTPWFIISKSFQYSRAFRGHWGQSPIKYRVMRSLVINNYQMDELLPIINYRIYKIGNLVWHFNPNPFNKVGSTGAHLFATKIREDEVFRDVYNVLKSSARVECVKVPGTNRYHYTVLIGGLWHDIVQYCLATNLTSNPGFKPNLKCWGTPAQKNPQTATHAELVPYENLEFKESYSWTGFQSVANELSLLKITLAYSIVFNSDGTSSLSLSPLYEHLSRKGIVFDLSTKPMFIKAGGYTQDLNRYITLNRLSISDLQTSKYLVLSEICPDLVNHTTSYKFSNKANNLLILPDTELIL